MIIKIMMAMQPPDLGGMFLREIARLRKFVISESKKAAKNYERGQTYKRKAIVCNEKAAACREKIPIVRKKIEKLIAKADAFAVEKSGDADKQRRRMLKREALLQKTSKLESKIVRLEALAAVYNEKGAKLKTKSESFFAKSKIYKAIAEEFGKAVDNLEKTGIR